LIGPTLSLRLGLQRIGRQAIVGLTGKRELLHAVELPSIGFGSIQIHSCRAAVFEVSKLGLPIDLILGVNAFGYHRIQFDFVDGRIYIIE